MKKSQAALAVLAASLGLAMGGCAILTPKTEAPAEARKVAEAIGNMKTRPADSCPTKKDAAELNSKVDTIKNGRETVYKADCEPKAKT